VILATKFGDRELRTTGEWGSESIIPSPDGYGAIPLGAATGLPAVGAAIRLYAGTVASLPINVFQGEDEKKKKKPDTWQAGLFKYQNDETARFSFFWDLASGLESCGNAFIFKSRMQRARRLGAMAILRPENMTIRRDRDTNELIYEWWNGRETRRIPTENILHIRGDTMGGGDIGYSPIQVHRMSLMGQLQREQFENRHFANDARPGVALMFPQGVSKDQADEFGNLWDSRHAGTANRGRTGVLGGGATIQTFPLSLEDQQWVESQKFSVEDVARMYGIPASMLEEGESDNPDKDALRWLKFGLGPRLTRIQDAFLHDPDFFGQGSKLYPEFFLDEFLKSDAVSMAQVDHELVQSGVLLVDEARAKRGMPPLKDGAGQIPQITPVGGAPNPVAATNGKT